MHRTELKGATLAAERRALLYVRRRVAGFVCQVQGALMRMT
jgi:membrane-bound lytic murein transglycosylase